MTRSKRIGRYLFIFSVRRMLTQDEVAAREAEERVELERKLEERNAERERARAEGWPEHYGSSFGVNRHLDVSDLSEWTNEALGIK